MNPAPGIAQMTPYLHPTFHHPNFLLYNIIQQDSKLPRKIYLLSQEGIFSERSVSPADFLWTPPFTPMKAANGVFVLSVEHDDFAYRRGSTLTVEATVRNVATYKWAEAG